MGVSARCMEYTFVWLPQRCRMASALLEAYQRPILNAECLLEISRQGHMKERDQKRARKLNCQCLNISSQKHNGGGLRIRWRVCSTVIDIKKAKRPLLKLKDNTICG